MKKDELSLFIESLIYIIEYLNLSNRFADQEAHKYMNSKKKTDRECLINTVTASTIETVLMFLEPVLTENNLSVAYLEDQYILLHNNKIVELVEPEPLGFDDELE